MAELTEPKITELDGWTFKIQPPRNGDSRRLLVLIHGWTGDENVMSIFAFKVPAYYWLIYPRGPVVAPDGGFGWLDRQDPDQSYETYREIAGQLWSRITALKPATGLNNEPVHLMGFSQGTAICYTLAVEHPDQIGRVAALAGYLPAGIQPHLDRSNLAGKPFFIAHGIKDDTVPVDRAREAVRALESSGAQVTYCEDSVGHKLSATCFRSLGEFFK